MNSWLSNINLYIYICKQCLLYIHVHFIQGKYASSVPNEYYRHLDFCVENFL